MMTVLFHAHSGLRYLVILIAVVTLVKLALAWKGEAVIGAGTRRLYGALVGLLDLQIVLGVVLFLQRNDVQGAHTHLTWMIGALIAAHIPSFLRRRGREVRPVAYLLATAVTLMLIVFGIQALGRSVF